MSSRPRTPGTVYGVLSVVLLLLVGLFAMTQRQPPPPTIAEFAPQSVDNITDAPTDQSSSVGRGAGTGGSGPGAEPTPEPSPTPVNVPRVRKCVGDPPRQIEDPQSPPCVPYWSGDNGGATSKGVTADTITLAAPEWDKDTFEPLQDFFNKRFEFYGRKLSIKDTSSKRGDQKPASQRAAAVYVDEEVRAFGSLTTSQEGGFHYYDELARRGIVGSESWDGTFSDEWLRTRTPYVWQYFMGAERMFSTAGAWMCKRFAHRKAQWAGSADLQAKDRKFGIILHIWNTDNPISTDSVTRELAGCGIPKEQVVALQFYGNEGDAAKTDLGRGTNAIAQMKSSGVTSILCLCPVLDAAGFARTASNQSYSPEWLYTTYTLIDANYTLTTLHAEFSQLAHTMGLTFQPRQVQGQDRPCLWATREVSDKDCGGNFSTSWYGDTRYRSLLLMASGIQMAGPKLTPQTFADGLHRAKFPNPDTPIKAGAVGFDAGDHTMTDDAAEWWWSNTDPAPYTDERSGTICYVARGERRTKATFPTEDGAFFQRPCDSGA